jgi:DNA-directed RNA polymerase subunit RPC12/RpoP
MVTKSFYCARCQEQVDCEKEDYVVTGDIGAEGYFCPLCGDQLDNEIDADMEYERIRDDKIFGGAE